MKGVRIAVISVLVVAVLGCVGFVIWHGITGGGGTQHPSQSGVSAQVPPRPSGQGSSVNQGQPPPVGGDGEDSSQEPSMSESDALSVLKTCMGHIERGEMLQAEKYVSESGKQFRPSFVTGVHWCLRDTFTFARNHRQKLTVSYGEPEVLSRQEEWIPVEFTRYAPNPIPEKLKVYMVNRGDGWKLESIGE